MTPLFRNLTSFESPLGGGVTPPKSRFYRVGESMEQNVSDDDIIELDYKTLKELIANQGKPQRVIIYRHSNRIKGALAVLTISNILTLALSSPWIYERVVLTIFFGLILSTLLLSLKDKEPKKEIKQERQSLPKLSPKDEHKRKTALAMLRQLQG